MFTDVEKVKFTIGLVGEAAEAFLSDEQIAYFLEKNNNNVDRACIACASAVKFQLAQYVHEKVTSDLEIWGNNYFENYAKALDTFINNPNSAFGINQIQVYAGGISVVDIRENLSNPDNHISFIDEGIPKDGEAINSTNTESDVFDPYKEYFQPYRY